jgi:hypothetical protein
MQCAGPLAVVFVAWLYFSQRGRLDEAAAGKKKKKVSLFGGPASERKKAARWPLNPFLLYSLKRPHPPQRCRVAAE